jgi:hypothetical protein
MKIGALKAMLYLRMSLKLSPYFLHFSTDLGKIHTGGAFYKWPCRKFCVGRCIVVMQTPFVWPAMTSFFDERAIATHVLRRDGRCFEISFSIIFVRSMKNQCRFKI